MSGPVTERGRPPGVALDRLLPRAELGGPDRTGTVRGDDTGATERFVYLDRERVGVFTGWAPLEACLGREGLLRVDPAGCQFLLAYGLVPPPYTLYANVYALGVGDRMEIAADADRARCRVEFPYFEASSRGDEVYDASKLEALLGEAVERAVPASGPVLLMQSSGKDSAGLLIGVAASGRSDVRAATYDPRYREDEAPDAADMAARFGVEHRTVTADPEAEYEAFVRFAARSPSICADVALFAYLRTLDVAGVDAGVVLDGLGNDAYLGYLPSRTDRWLAAASLARRFPSLWGRGEPPAIGDRPAYLVKTMQMYPAERSLAGSRLSPATVTDLLPYPTPFGSYFREVDRRCRELDPVDARAYVRGRFFDGAGTLPKGRLSAAAHGARAVYPYCDAALIDYCFHLPRADRYDVASGTNKVGLRRLIAERMPESRYLRAKGSFRYDILRFVERNEAAIRRELDAARPLLRNLDRWSRYFLDRRAGYVHAYALTTLFMLVAWLVRRPAEVVRPLADGDGHSPSATVIVEP